MKKLKLAFYDSNIRSYSTSRGSGPLLAGGTESQCKINAGASYNHTTDTVLDSAKTCFLCNSEAITVNFDDPSCEFCLILKAPGL